MSGFLVRLSLERGLKWLLPLSNKSPCHDKWCEVNAKKEYHPESGITDGWIPEAGVSPWMWQIISCGLMQITGQPRQRECLDLCFLGSARCLTACPLDLMFLVKSYFRIKASCHFMAWFWWYCHLSAKKIAQRPNLYIVQLLNYCKSKLYQ